MILHTPKTTEQMPRSPSKPRRLISLVRAGFPSLHSRSADWFTGNNHLYSPVLLPARCVVIGGYRQRITVALGAHGVCHYALFHEVIAHRVSEILRQFHVHIVATNVVGVAAYFDDKSWIGDKNPSNLSQFFPRSGL